MSSEWAVVRLGDVVDLLTGFPFKSADYTDCPSAPRLIRGDNVAQGVLRWSGVKRWPTSLLNRLDAYSLQEDDVILAMDRPWIDAGLKYAAVSSGDLPCLLVQRVARLRGTSRVDTGFLKYVIGSRSFTEHVLAVQTGTAVPHISGAQIRGFEFALPPITEQRAIGHILGSFDDKIELNRRMSGTLEEMARVIFRGWFDAATSVTPRSERSQLSRLADIADVTDCLHSKKPERQQSGLPLLQLNNIRDDGLLDLGDTYFISEQDYAAWTSRMEVVQGDCVITNVGRVGAVAQIPQGVRAALGRNMTGIRCKPSFPFPTFLIECLRSASMREQIELHTDSGTILDALNVRSIPKLPIPVPPQADASRFEDTVRPIRARMELCLSESATLAALRDTLLPKLISGELRVKEAEKAVEAVL